MAAVNSEEAHAAWHASVAKAAAERGVEPNALPPPPADTAWFQSGHSRRTEGMRPPQPADEARAAAEEGVVRELQPATLPERAAAAAAPAPQPVAAAIAPAAPAPTPTTLTQRGPAAAAARAAGTAAPPLRSLPPSQRPVPPLPEMQQSVFGGALLDWVGPFLAVLVGVLSMYIFSKTNGPAGAAQLPAGRYFSPVNRVAALSAKLYDGIKDLPLICPHGHVDAAIFADPTFRFSDPAALFITPDHYVYRMLASQGIALEALGVPGPDGVPLAEVEPRAVWRLFAENYHLFRGTPTSVWFREALALNFNITERLTPRNADAIYDAIDGALASGRLRPRALLDAFNIEVLATTNAATDDLSAHIALRAAPGLRGRVVPTFRPDEVSDPARATWRSAVAELGRLTGEKCDTFASFLAALRSRRAHFAAAGATAADHGAELPVAAPLPAGRAEELYRTALKKGTLGDADLAAFRAHMLVEHARMSAADGLVMQLHAGVARNHDAALFRRFGADRGGDIPLAADWTRGLAPLLAELGHHENLTLVVFTLDEATYSRELAPLAGVYSSLRLGPPWWFLDSPHGMRRYLDAVVETAGVANLAGFNDDTRALLSIPARHALWRRAVADWAAEAHARGLLDWEDARAVAYDLAYGQAKKTYKL